MNDLQIIPPKEHHSYQTFSTTLVRQARGTAKATLLRARHTAKKYLTNARTRCLKAGYKAGLELAKAELQQTLCDLNKELENRIASAEHHVADGAMALAAMIVGAELRSRESAYRIWMQQALNLLRQEECIFIHCSPEQECMMSELTQGLIPRCIVTPDPTLSSPDVYVRSSFGKIGFGWREALERAAAHHKQSEAHDGISR